MRDLDNSLNFNYSRYNSNGWLNLNFDDASQDFLVNKNQSMNQSLFQFHALLSEPPRPAASIYNCIQSDHEENGDIKEVEYFPNEPQAKHVNAKQYFRMMKQRIKKVLQELAHGAPKDLHCEAKTNKRDYLYESRHKHALRRKRGKDGKFLASILYLIQHDPNTSALERRKKEGENLRISKNKHQSLPKTRKLNQKSNPMSHHDPPK